MNGRWLAALAPLGLGLLLAALTQFGPLANPIVYARADIASLAVLAGAGLSALAALGLLTRRRAAQRGNRAITQAHQHASEERRRFLRRLDHELKNPLMAIRAGLANLGTTAASNGDDALDSITAQTVRLSRLTADLRKLADLETATLERAPVDVAGLLRAVLAAAQERPEAADRRLALSLPQAPWPLPPVAGDEDLLFLAVHNLVDNALKFTRPGDTIEIRAFEDHNSVMIEVADTGPGISEADIAHVWDELYRSQAAQGTPGSGLGLALVRAVVARHGGEPAIRSRANRGTVVVLRLPARADDTPT